MVAKHHDGVEEHYGRVSETPCFPGENSQEISYYGESTLLRHSIFSTAGSFGWGGSKVSD